MVGIEAVGYYICEKRESNLGKEFDGCRVDDALIKNKVGIEHISLKDDNENISDICVKAYQNLLSQFDNFDVNEIDCICLCGHRGDYIAPHTSAVIQHKIGAKTSCAAFDIGLGCNGYIYSLDIVKHFMIGNGFKKALLFTCDSLTDIVDKTDKSTSILFGDAASVTLLSSSPKYIICKPTYHTYGAYADIVNRDVNNKLFMDGKALFFYALQYIPRAVKENMKLNNVSKDIFDLFIFHQANKYMVETFASYIKADLSKVPYDIKDYGNTGPSSIPIVLAKHIDENLENIYLAAIGDGLSIACMPIKKV